MPLINGGLPVPGQRAQRLGRVSGLASRAGPHQPLQFVEEPLSTLFFCWHFQHLQVIQLGQNLSGLVSKIIGRATF